MGEAILFWTEKFGPKPQVNPNPIEKIWPICYEENLFMAWGKPQQTQMTAEINSNPRYAI